nr:hypothetical protein [Tanacetum cinerariifolium]
KVIAKQIIHPSKLASKEDSDPEQAQRDKNMQKNLAFIAKYFKKIYKPTNNNLRTFSNSRNKNVDTTPKYKNDNHTRQFENQRTMNFARARETVGSQVQYDAGYNVFANETQHFEQPKFISNTCVVETGDSNVIPDSLDMCDNDIQNDQNAVECDDEHVALANLITDLKLHVDENKKIQKQLKKANTTLAYELTECKSILAKTSRTLEESNSIRDNCLNFIEKCKGKSMETKFDKPYVVRQPNAPRIPKPSVLGKPAPFLDSLEKKHFSKTKSVHKTNVSEGVAHRTNVSRRQLTSTLEKYKVVTNNSQVKDKKTEVEDHPRISNISNKIKSVTACKDSLKSKTLNVNDVCASCGKCLFDSDHFARVTKILNDVNARTKKHNVVPVKDKQEKDKIGTKPNKNEKRGKARQCQNSVTIKKAEKIPVCYDDDDDYNSAITPNEPIDSLSMWDEHLNTISATESDEFIKSCVENLVPNLSESKGENRCNVPACFTTFSNVLFDAEYEFDSSDDQSLSDEDFMKEINSNPLFEEEIIYIKIDPHHFNAESDLIEYLLNRDSSIIPSSSKNNSLLDEFVDELALLKSIPLGIDKTDCYPENEIRLTKRLLYDNSSPRLSEEFVFENSNADIEYFSPYPIPIEDSDSFIEEINLSFNPNDPMPPDIEEDDYDSERDILICKELVDNYSLSLPVVESYHFDIPSFSPPPVKPPDGNTGILNIKMMGDIFEQKVPIPGLTITRVLNQEKSPNLLSHRSLENFQLSAKYPMMIHGKNIPILDFVQYSRKFEDSYQRILSSKSSFPQLQLGINSQPLLKSSYKAEASVKISIPSLVGGVADVVVEIKGTDYFDYVFSVGCQKPGRLADEAGTFREERSLHGIISPMRSLIFEICVL